MNSKAFSLSLIIAGIAMFMVYAYIDGERSKLVSKYGREKAVVVAKEDIKAFELIDDKKVKVINLPDKFVHPNAIRKISDVENTIAQVPIKKDEVITTPRITYPGVKTGLSRQITPGKRAIAIPVNPANAIAKLIKPGDRIDVVAKIDPFGGDKERIFVKTILQDVLILSTGKNISNSIPLHGVRTPREIKLMNLDTFSNFNEVTVELTPAEAQKVIYLLADNAKFYLSLRNNDDRETATVRDTKIYDVAGEDAAAIKAYFQQRKK